MTRQRFAYASAMLGLGEFWKGNVLRKPILITVRGFYCLLFGILTLLYCLIWDIKAYKKVYELPKEIWNDLLLEWD